MTWILRHQLWLWSVLGVVLAALLFEALRGVVREIRYDEVTAAIQSASVGQLGIAVLAMLVSYLALTGYDHASLRYVGARVPYRVVAPTAFIAYALSNTVGLSVLSGGAVRMRLYGAAGVEVGLISRAIAFNALAFGLGITTVGAAALLWGADTVAPVAHLPPLSLQLIALLMLGAMVLLLVGCALGRELRFGRAGRERRVQLPGLSLALEQLAWSALDITASAAVLWILLPAGVISLPVFIGFFAIAVVLGVISHVPGGLGVFEAVMLVALGGRIPTEQLAGALVLFRVIYYLLPLAMAVLLLAGYEIRRAATGPVVRAAGSLSPVLLSAFTFVVGVMLLASGVFPATEDATELLSRYVPLPLVEASHFFGSVAGLGLILIARGMWHRLNAAWWAGVVLAAVSLVLALPKGIALSEALVLSLQLIVLVLSRREFTRKAALFSQAFSWQWLLTLAAVLVAITGLLFFAYEDVDYAHELWWQFEFDGHASRSLRAVVGVALLILMLAVRQLFRAPAVKPGSPTADQLDRAQAIVLRQDSAGAVLALSGDKQLLFSASEQSFLMYGIRGRSWVGLYDPIGRDDEHADLVWRLLERASESGGRASFYQVRPNKLPIYIDAGLSLFKLGEDAFVPLKDFSLKGSSRAGLRHGVSRAEREGLSFSVIPLDEVRAALPELRRISNAWLAEHNTAEKGFSLGAFDDDYIARQPVAVIHHGADMVAFATLMTTHTRVEASIDLMRQVPGAPKSTMDLLFAKLILHFQAEGYQRFGLGMAPLSGMANHPLAPNWHRLGRLLYAHGEHFYNFQGLRAFKEKFAPVWEPRYLAAPGGVAPLIVLTDITALISGGFKGVIAK